MKKKIALLLTASLLFASGSCAVRSNNWGTIRENHEVTRLFRSYEIRPDYNYFYYGVFLEPDTIMGIDKKYTVQSKFWKPLALSSDQLKRWVRDLDRSRDDANFARSYMGSYQGAYILDPERSAIGIWYSKLDWGVFHFPGENVIIAYPPSLKPGSESIRFRPRDD